MKEIYIGSNEKDCVKKLRTSFYHVVTKQLTNAYDGIVFLCIGTDRSTGDSLGPLVGYKLLDKKPENIHVYGSLENPVHAQNLQETIRRIYKSMQKPLIVAVDACLGKIDDVGYIRIGEGPIKPGSAVDKDLGEVGDVHIVGIVNFGDFMDFLVLQNTRLNLVMKIADTINTSVRSALKKIQDASECVKTEIATTEDDEND